MKKNNAEMRALMEIRKVIDEMLGHDFDTRRKPALMALKVSKTEAVPEEMAVEEVSEGMHEMPSGKMMPDSEMPSDEETKLEVEAPAVELEVESKSDEEQEEDSDAVKQLKVLLMNK